MKRRPVQFVLLIVFAASVMFTGRVLAHALLVRSVPESNAVLSQPPATIELWFSEPIESDFSSIRILASSGGEIALGTQTVDPNDPAHLIVVVGEIIEPGSYTVAWRTLSRTDGHEWLASFPFTVLNPDGSRPPGTATTLETQERSELPTPLQTLARWLALTGAMLLVGIALFLGYVTPEVMQSNPELETRLNGLGVKLLGVAVLVIVLGSWLQVVIQAAQLEDLSTLPRLVYATQGGVLSLARQAFSVCGLLMVLWLSPQILQPYQRRMLRVAGVYAACLMGLIVVAGFQGQGLIATLTLLTLSLMALLTLGSMGQLAWFNTLFGDDKRWLLLLLSGTAALFCFSLGSHAGAAPGAFWAIGFDMVHFGATSAWLGGLMLLPLALEQYRKSFSDGDTSALRPLFRRYGQMAKLSFFLLWTTGLLSSLVQLPTIESLVNTNYGRVLIIKVLLMLAVWWLSIHASRLFRGRPDPAHMVALLKQFSRQVSIAVFVGLVLMFSVAVLVQTQPPPRNIGAAYSGYTNLVEADDLRIHFQISPAQIGQNEFYVHLNNKDGSVARDVQLVQLIFEEQNAQLGQSKVELQSLRSGTFWIDGAFLNRSGDWNISVYVRRRGLDDLIADVGALTLPMPPPPNNPFQNPVPAVPPAVLLGGVLVIVGLEILRWRKALQQTQPVLFKVFPYMGGTLILIGVIMGIYSLIDFLY